MIFYLSIMFAILAIVCSICVITVKNPIHSILYLVLVFINISFILIIWNIEFLAIIILIVYVGAIAVSFLFVIMMLNIKIITLKEVFWRYIFLGFVVICLFGFELYFIWFDNELLENVKNYLLYSNISDIYSYYRIYTNKPPFDFDLVACSFINEFMLESYSYLWLNPDSDKLDEIIKLKSLETTLGTQEEVICECGEYIPSAVFVNTSHIKHPLLSDNILVLPSFSYDTRDLIEVYNKLWDYLSSEQKLIIKDLILEAPCDAENGCTVKTYTTNNDDTITIFATWMKYMRTHPVEVEAFMKLFKFGNLSHVSFEPYLEEQYWPVTPCSYFDTLYALTEQLSKSNELSYCNKMFESTLTFSYNLGDLIFVYYDIPEWLSVTEKQLLEYVVWDLTWDFDNTTRTVECSYDDWVGKIVRYVKYKNAHIAESEAIMALKNLSVSYSETSQYNGNDKVSGSINSNNASLAVVEPLTPEEKLILSNFDIKQFSLSWIVYNALKEQWLINYMANLREPIKSYYLVKLINNDILFNNYGLWFNYEENKQNTETLGWIIYNYNFFCFFIISLILLLVMVGTIVLVLNQNINTKKQVIYKQVMGKMITSIKLKY